MSTFCHLRAAVAGGEVLTSYATPCLPVTHRHLSCMSGSHLRCTVPHAQTAPSALQSSPGQHRDLQSTGNHCLTPQHAAGTRLGISAQAAWRGAAGSNGYLASMGVRQQQIYIDRVMRQRGVSGASAGVRRICNGHAHQLDTGRKCACTHMCEFGAPAGGHLIAMAIPAGDNNP